MPSVLIAGKSYEVPEDFTLGELRTVKLAFGARLVGSEVDSTDPDIMCALAYVAMHRVDPTVTPVTVENLSLSDIATDPDAAASDTAEHNDEMGPTVPQL